MILTDERIKEIAEEAERKGVRYEPGYETFDRAIESAIRQALKEALEWRDMESAPRGERGYAWMCLKWGPEENESRSSGMRYGDRFFAASTFYQPGREQQFELEVIEVRPTGWMPLPPFGPTVDKG